MRDEEEQKKPKTNKAAHVSTEKKCVGWECLAYFTKVISQNMKIKACGYVCGTFGHLARSFGEFHLRIWPRHLILFIYLFVAA